MLLMALIQPLLSLEAEGSEGMRSGIHRDVLPVYKRDKSQNHPISFLALILRDSNTGMIYLCSFLFVFI